MRAVLICVAFVAACGESSTYPEPDSAEHAAMTSQRKPRDVLIAHYIVPREELLAQPDADPRAEREALIAKIGELYPVLVQDGALAASLRGEVGYVLLSLPEEYSDVAPLVARAYQLLEIERARQRGMDIRRREEP
jgi:hypothetical protein